MISVKYSILDEVFFLNTASGKFEKAEVKGVQIVPTGISTDEEGRRRLDGYAVLYQTVEGTVLSESEAFGSEDECREHWKKVLGV